MVNRPKALGTARVCACGCGERPRNWKAQYVAGHRPLRPLAERLWSRCARQPNGCLEWQGFCHSTRGYGQMGRGRRSEGLIETHRAAWEVTHGPIPAGAFVLHRCDNPPCCDPDHLFLGSNGDNVADMVAKGRQAKGLRLPQTKLSDNQVTEIRVLHTEGWSQQRLAGRFGITQGYVSQLLAGSYRSGA